MHGLYNGDSIFQVILSHIRFNTWTYTGLIISHAYVHYDVQILSIVLKMDSNLSTYVQAYIAG
jgi:hypothetical protein